MGFSAFAISLIMLCGQVESSNGQPAAGGSPEESLVEIPRARRPTPAEPILADILRPREDDEDEISGRLMSLEEAVRRGKSPNQVALAYWNVSLSLGRLHVARDDLAWLSSLSADGESGELSAAVAASRARESAARAALVRAQHALAGLLQWEFSELPDTVETPHVGPYRTKFDVLFRHRAAPLPARRTHRTLPLIAAELDLRAEAVLAAEQARNAFLAESQSGQVILSELLDSQRQYRQQQETFLSTVYAYNKDIADYATAVGGELVPPHQFVSMLIHTSRGQPGQTNESTVAPDKQSGSASVAENSDGSSHKNLENGADPNTLAYSVGERSLVRKPNSYDLTPRDLGGYSGLEPRVRTQRLVHLLHNDALLPTDDASRAFDLADYLENIQAADRRKAIVDYWSLCRQIAVYRVLLDRVQRIELLCAASPTNGDSEANGIENQVCQSRLALAAADLARSRRRVEEAETLILSHLQLDAVEDWVLPITPPHGGRFNTKIEKIIPAGSTSTNLARQAQMLGVYYQVMADRADAVIAADSVRTRAEENWQTGSASLDSMLEAIDQQASEMIALIDAARDYNLAIVAYVLDVVPSLSNSRLASALVIKHTVQGT